MTMRDTYPSLVGTFLLLLGTGCSSSALNSDGGTDGGGKSDVPTAMANCPDDSVPLDPTAVIDDMESPNFQTNMPGDRGGSWWAGGDDASKAAGAAITPDGNVNSEAIPGGRCGSRYAVRVTGHGFGEWAVVDVAFGYGSVDGGPPQILPYDASFRTGIDFWARIGDTSTDQVRLAITDKYSNDVGGICDKTATGDPSKYCYDHFSTPLTKLSTEWRHYRIPFRGLAQQGFGVPRPQLDTTALYSIDFNFPNAVFDFWVDDISFY
jgi:hypothetical protein